MASALCRADPTAARLADGCTPEYFMLREPARRAIVPRLGIDRHEVTVARWRRCVRAGHCPPPRLRFGDPRFDRPELPVTGITRREAAAYCDFAGGRLPTADEWERAARGPRLRLFPWGDHWHPRAANLGASGRLPSTRDGVLTLWPVGWPSGDVTPEGTLDMGGNVSEWTATDLSAPSTASPRWAPRPGSRVAAVKGGSWRTPPWSARGAAWRALPADHAFDDVGFRCVYTPER